MKNLNNKFESIEEMIDEGFRWTEEEASTALQRKLEERLPDYINRLSDIKEGAEELLFDVNAAIYLENQGYEPVFDMDMFDEILEAAKPYEIAKKIHCGNFNPCHRYFKIDDLNNLESSDWISDLQPDITDIEDTCNIIINAIEAIIDYNAKKEA